MATFNTTKRIAFLAVCAARAKLEKDQPEWLHDLTFYMRSPSFELRRREAWNRCGGICEHPTCTKPAQELHHRTYATRGREFLGDLLYLCRECHRRVHFRVIANDNQLELFKKTG